MDDLAALVAHWPVRRVALGVTDPDSILGLTGDLEWQTRIASVGKLFVGYAALVAIEEHSLELDDPAGPDGSTVRHVLAHASGMGFDTFEPVTRVGARRVYSNAGIEYFADYLAERTGFPIGQYLQEAVFDPLGMVQTEVRGSPAYEVWSSLDDLLAFSRELLNPTLVTQATLDDATRPHFPELSGVVPGMGRFDPNSWGLTFELKVGKPNHWTGRKTSPRTFGHFGGAGTYLWVDPDAGLACVALTDREFDTWALDVWPATNDHVIERYRTPQWQVPH
ncbi:MAG: beta-lactamase family protein [Acidimicrobiia bacterium]|nr:beta-lactamase family protein [Acidimicrobiia bacterium]